MRRLREADEAKRLAAAEAQRKLADRADAAKKAVKALEPRTDAAKNAAKKAADALEAAQASMEQAAEAQKAGKPGEAGASGEKAEASLDEAQSALEDASGDAADEADARERLKALREEQQKIKEKLKQLEDLLRKVESPSASASAKAAEERMDEAARQMDSGASPKAEKSAEEARRYLEQLKKDLEQERRRYESMRQEEMLFNLVKDLKEFRVEQQRVRDEVKRIVEAAPDGRLARPQRQKLKLLGADEEKLRDKVGVRVKAVKEEGSPAFGTALEGAEVDMAEIVRLLEEVQSLDVAQGLADEVIHRLSDLVAAFEEEIDRRRTDPPEAQPKDDGQGGGGNQKPALVPPLVEIKLLRRLQLDVNGKLDSFWKRNPSLREGRVDDAQRRTLERIYNEQGHIADDLEKLIQSVFGQRR